MFIRTDRIQPPGTIVQLEFSLADGSSLVKGQAEVVWVRKRNESPDRPSGLGLRFLDLDKQSRQLIRWAVELRLRDSKTSTDDKPKQAPATDRTAKSSEPLATEAKVATPPAGESPPKQQPSQLQGSTTKNSRAQKKKGADQNQLESRLHSYAGSRAVQKDGSRWRWAAYLAMAGLLASALLFLYRGSESGSVVRESEPEATRPAETIATIQRTQAVAPAAAEPSDNEPIKAPEQLPSPESEITTAVSSWAEAWSMQRVDDYLDCYAADFQPVGNLSQAQWREGRRDRIAAPASIEVAVSDLEVQLLNDERAQVSFLQSYRSDHYQDHTRKTLELVRENESWKIQVERSES